MIASRLPLTVVIVIIVGLAVTGNLFSRSPVVIALQMGAVAFNLWARRSFPKEAFRVEAVPAASSVMRHGPYRFVRHPMYSSVLLLIWAGIASHASRGTLAVGLAVTAIVVTRIVAEERLLRSHYPDYPEYARTTKALVPFVV